MRFFAKDLVLLDLKTMEGKNGEFQVATIGCGESFTKVEVFVRKDIRKKIREIKPGELVDVVIDVEQAGFAKNITLVDVESVSSQVMAN